MFKAIPVVSNQQECSQFYGEVASSLSLCLPNIRRPNCTVALRFQISLRIHNFHPFFFALVTFPRRLAADVIPRAHAYVARAKSRD
jgi:hypothetical protein